MKPILTKKTKEVVEDSCRSHDDSVGNNIISSFDKGKDGDQHGNPNNQCLVKDKGIVLIGLIHPFDIEELEECLGS